MVLAETQNIALSTRQQHCTTDPKGTLAAAETSVEKDNCDTKVLWMFPSLSYAGLQEETL